MNQKGLHPMVQMNIRIDSATKEALEKLAKDNKRSLSDYVRLVLEDHVQGKG